MIYTKELKISLTEERDSLCVNALKKAKQFVSSMKIPYIGDLKMT